MSLNFGRVQPSTKLYYSFIISRPRVNIDHRLYSIQLHTRPESLAIAPRKEKKYKKKSFDSEIVGRPPFSFSPSTGNSTQRDFEASDTTDLICQKFLRHDRRLFSRTNASGKRGGIGSCRKKSIPHFWGCSLACLCLFE